MTNLYGEGDWLWIPLGKSSSHAIGRVARVGPRGKIMLVYAFGPPLRSKPSASELDMLQSSSAVMIRMCGDLGIICREWEVIARPTEFDRTAWPMPAFGQWSGPDFPGVRVDYPADAPNTDPVATLVTYEEASQLPPDGIDGYKAFEAHLCMALGILDGATGSNGQPATSQHYSYFLSERVAKSAAKQMVIAVPGGTVEIRHSDDEWLVILSHGHLVDSMDIAEVTDRLTQIAIQRHGRYDGWQRDA
jgi:hypothetical protein